MVFEFECFLFLKMRYYYFPEIASYSRPTKQMLQSKKQKIAIGLNYYKATSNSKFYTIQSYYENRIFEACNHLKKGFLSDILVFNTCVQNYLQILNL